MAKAAVRWGLAADEPRPDSVLDVLGEVPKMKWNEIRKQARNQGVNTRNLKKVEVIRALQRAEGNFDCFGRSDDFCDRGDCAWLGDCVKQTRMSA